MNINLAWTKKQSRTLWLAIACISLVTLACNIVFGSPPPTQLPPPILPTQEVPTQVVIPPPSSTPAPVIIEDPSTSTMEIPATAEDPLMAEVRTYYEKGYLPFQNGVLTSLPDFSKKQPSTTNIHDLTRTGAEAQDFALWAEIELNSSGQAMYPKYTGCGFAYRVQNNDAGYTAILTNEYARMGACSNNMYACKLFGPVFGSGQVNVLNQTQARFSLAVNQDHAYVLVDGILVGQYDLYTTRLQGTGAIEYDVVSNYPAGYWSSCRITNVKLWESLP